MFGRELIASSLVEENNERPTVCKAGYEVVMVEAALEKGTRGLTPEAAGVSRWINRGLYAAPACIKTHPVAQ